MDASKFRLLITGEEMIKTKEVEQPAKKQLIVVGIICDLCGESTKSYGCWPKDQSGAVNREGNVNEVSIQYECGYSYSDGGSLERTIVDMCPQCFHKKLLPWIKSQGGNPHVEESDF